MEEPVKRGCGIDIDSLRLWVTVFITTLTGKVKMDTIEFDNSVDGIEKLITWLRKKKVTHVAFESTGNYWQMLYSFLEYHFTVIVANPRQIKQLKGKKTDPHDAKNIARLLRLGVIEPSFILPHDLREIRDLTRQYQNMIHDWVRVKNRITKTLRHACITLDAYMADIFGVSGQVIIQSLIDGVPGKEAAKLVKGKLKKNIPNLEAALRYPLSNHYREILARYWRQYLFLQDELANLDIEINMRMKPYKAPIKQLQTLPGFGQKMSCNIISEMGDDMSCFPKAENLCSWVKICPGNNSSGGKRKSGRNSKGNKYLRSYLVEAAWAAVRTRGSEFRELYYRRCARLGKKKAIVSVAHKMLRIIYTMLSKGIDYDKAYELHNSQANKKAWKNKGLVSLTNEELVSELLSRGADKVIWSWEDSEAALTI